jgi:hypothetical protein
MLSDSSQTVTAVTALVKEIERGGQGHTSKAYCISCHVTSRCEQALFLHKCLFDSVFCFVCDGWQN